MLATSSGSAQQEFVEIGDIKVPLNDPKFPELVPSGNLHYWGRDLDHAPAEVIGHLRWMAQKSLLGQDIFLTGPPTGNRRRLILTLAELCGWECEYLMITKDTTEADLKQRREIVGDSVVWCDAAPVRAAIHGRVLIIDGMENAERNVLPTINNLLENREMMLEDGRFLMKGDTIDKLQHEDRHSVSAVAGKENNMSARLVPVHPAFRVVALGLPVPPYHGRVLDPPLRSRFQSRFVDELSLDDALHCVDTSGGSRESLKAVAGVYEGLRAMRAEAVKDGSGAAAVPCFSVDGLRHCLHLLRHTDASIGGAVKPPSVANALSRSLPLGYAWRGTATHKSEIAVGSSLSQKHKTMLQAIMEKVKQPQDAVAHSAESIRTTATVWSGPTAAQLTAHQQTLLQEVTQDLSLGRNVCLLGGKGSGKSFVLAEVAARARQDMLVFPVYQEMSGRDLLQRRGTTSVAAQGGAGSVGSGEKKNATSLWLDSPLVKAARTGKLCALDGIDRMDAQALLGIRSLVSSPTLLPADADGHGAGGIERREIDLPSGERLLVHPDFRLIGIGAPPTKSEDARMRYLNSDLNLSYHLLPDMTPADIERVLLKATSLFIKGHADFAHAAQLRSFDEQLVSAVTALYAVAGKQHPELRPTLRHMQRVQSTIRTMLESGSGAALSTAEDRGALVYKLLSQALLVRFLPAASSAKFDVAMESAGLRPPATTSGKSRNKFMKFLQKTAPSDKKERTLSVDTQRNTVNVGDVTVSRRQCALPELVPQPLFHENASHLAVLEALLLSYKASYETSEKAILLIGNQGVGKNKLVDCLLQVSPREDDNGNHLIFLF
jgi:MoxR-like ATPase